MKFSTVISALSIIALVGCASGPHQRNINEIPEYGNQPKSPEMLRGGGIYGIRRARNKHALWPMGLRRHGAISGRMIRNK